MVATGVRLAVTSLRIQSWGYEVEIWISGRNFGLGLGLYNNIHGAILRFYCQE
jgi:hypothetical protein